MLAVLRFERFALLDAAVHDQARGELIVERVEVTPPTPNGEQGPRTGRPSWLHESLEIVVAPLPQIWAAAETQVGPMVHGFELARRQK